MIQRSVVLRLERPLGRKTFTDLFGVRGSCAMCCRSRDKISPRPEVPNSAIKDQGDKPMTVQKHPSIAPLFLRLL